jgi:hypothetical protein
MQLFIVQKNFGSAISTLMAFTLTAGKLVPFLIEQVGLIVHAGLSPFVTFILSFFLCGHMQHLWWGNTQSLYAPEKALLSTIQKQCLWSNG